MSAAAAAGTLSGKAMLDGYLCRCPVPSHGQGKGDKNPSLFVKDGDKSLLVHCFAGCDARDVLDAFRRRGLVDASGRAAPRAAPPVQRRRTDAALHQPDPTAVERWRQAGPIAGSQAERYLRGRGLVIELPPSLRAINTVEHLVGSVGLPAMIAAVQAPTRRVVAIQVTWLEPRGDRKAQVAVPRRTIGALGLGAVRLGAAGAELGLAEGVEDALGAMQLTGVPTWACLGAGRMHRVQIPDNVRLLHVFADDDRPGRAAAERTATHHRAQGRRVVIRLAPAGVKDWADFAAASSTNLAAVPA